VVELRERLAHQRTDRAAGREDEIQHHRSAVVDLIGERDLLAIVPNEVHGGNGIVRHRCNSGGGRGRRISALGGAFMRECTRDKSNENYSGEKH
jgi:hypothetical protein